MFLFFFSLKMVFVKIGQRITWTCVFCHLTLDWSWEMGRERELTSRGHLLCARCAVPEKSCGCPERSSGGHAGLCHPVGIAASCHSACAWRDRERDSEHRLQKSLALDKEASGPAPSYHEHSASPYLLTCTLSLHLIKGPLKCYLLF